MRSSRAQVRECTGTSARTSARARSARPSASPSLRRASSAWRTAQLHRGERRARALRFECEGCAGPGGLHAHRLARRCARTRASAWSAARVATARQRTVRSATTVSAARASEDSECSGGAICDEADGPFKGQCVECTQAASDEALCGGKSCNPAKRACTGTECRVGHDLRRVRGGQRVRRQSSVYPDDVQWRWTSAGSVSSRPPPRRDA